MKKEILLAIIAGGTLGLIIAFGIWKGNSLLKIKKEDAGQVESMKTTNPSSSPTNSQGIKIAIVKPENLQVLTNTPSIISGITNPNSYVVISGEDSDKIVNASESGNFNEKIDLIGGANQIKLFTFANDRTSTNTNLLVTYSSQFELSETAKGLPTTYIGTITDITNSIIQIKNEAGDIEQISSNTNTSFVDTRNNTVKQIKNTDIAIGDYLLALGYKDGNNILNSSRIIITESLKKTTRTAFYGTVTDDSGVNKFIAKNPKTNETITITPAKGITITGAETSFGKIKNNEKVIAVGELKDGSIDARTILVVK